MSLLLLHHMSEYLLMKRVGVGVGNTLGSWGETLKLLLLNCRLVVQHRQEAWVRLRCDLPDVVHLGKSRRRLLGRRLLRGLLQLLVDVLLLQSSLLQSSLLQSLLQSSLLQEEALLQ